MSERDVSKGARLLRLVVRHWAPARITIEAGSAMVGVQPCTLWRWLDGQSKPCAEETLKIERVFGISPRSWFE